jgi:DNA-binding SARP family transcriptional activator/TolB-like protein
MPPVSDVREAPQTAAASAGRESSASLIRVSMLGSFDLARGPRSAKLTRRKTQALLAYLLLSSARAETRERLCGLFWSESDQAKAQASLRQSLHELRGAFDDLGFCDFRIGRDEIYVNKQTVQVDVSLVLEAAARGEVHPLLLENERLTERLLPGFDDLDPAFRPWLIGQRQLLKQRLESHLEAALGQAQAGSTSIKSVANALLNLDPSNELACRRLMETYAQRGDVAGALNAYRALWQLLRDDYDTVPSSQTQELVERIKRGALSGQRTTAASTSRATALLQSAEARSTPPRSFLAAQLLGFAPLSPASTAETKTFLVVSEFDCAGIRDGENYRVRGFRQELVAKLVRFRDWIVLNGNQEGADFATAARTTGSRYFGIEAKARKVRKSIALRMRVMALNEGRCVWEETYSLDLDQWKDAQRTIIGRIAISLNVHISVERLVSTMHQPDIALNVYDRWLRGQQLYLSWNSPDWLHASEVFQTVIEQEPEFAPAYSSLVQLENSKHIALPGVMRTQERVDRTLALSKLAVQLDPLDSRAHLCRAWSFALNDQFDLAELCYELALDHNEHDPWTLISAAQGLSFCGRTDEGAELADRGLSLDLKPSLPHWGYRAGIRFLYGDYRGCIEASLNAKDVISNLPAWRAAAFAHLGYHEDARAAAKQFVDRIRLNWHSSVPPTNEVITRWVLHCFPLRRESDWRRLRDGLSGARLPAPSLRRVRAA